MKIELSPATEFDAEELVLLRIAAMRESLERIGRFDPARVRERFLAGFSALDTKHIMSDGKRVGLNNNLERERASNFVDAFNRHRSQPHGPEKDKSPLAICPL